MTLSAIAREVAPAVRVVRRSGFTIAADGSYAACLAEAGPPGAGWAEAAEAGSAHPAPWGGPAAAMGSAEAGPPGAGIPAYGSPAGLARAAHGGEGPSDGGGRWFPERWTLDGTEPYAVPLLGTQPERRCTQVLPLSDGRVLVRRRVAERYDLALLYPIGPGTGELPLCSLSGTHVRLLPPSPVPGTGFALVHQGGVTAVWQVYGEGAPMPVTTVEGRCTGGVWLDRTGRLLALDRELDGRTKTVAADLHTGGTSPLLQITEDSDDRLLLAEPDSGLLLLRSDATGETRLGWGVLGSRHPVRFPDALRVPGALLTPVAAQPGQILSPEACVVALRAEVPGGAESLALWRPGERRLHWRASPPGWLGPAALWLPGDDLRLPYAAPEWPCGLVAYGTPEGAAGAQAGLGPEADAGPAPDPNPHPGTPPDPQANTRVHAEQFGGPDHEGGTPEVAARAQAGLRPEADAGPAPDPDPGTPPDPRADTRPDPYGRPAPATAAGTHPASTHPDGVTPAAEPPLRPAPDHAAGPRRERTRSPTHTPVPETAAPNIRSLSVIPLQQAPLAAAQAG